MKLIIKTLQLTLDNVGWGVLTFLTVQNLRITYSQPSESTVPPYQCCSSIGSSDCGWSSTTEFTTEKNRCTSGLVQFKAVSCRIDQPGSAHGGSSCLQLRPLNRPEVSSKRWKRRDAGGAGESHSAWPAQVIAGTEQLRRHRLDRTPRASLRA